MDDAGRSKVLVVDDVPDLADTLGMILEIEGFQVEIAYSGQAALEAVDAFVPDLVVLDIMMPEMDGFEVARRLRSEHPGWQVVLIALSALPPRVVEAKAFGAGFDRFLQKPVDLVAFADLLRRAVPRSRPRCPA